MWDWIASYGAWILTVVGGLVGLVGEWIIDDEHKPALVRRAKWFMRGGLLAAILGGGLSGFYQLASETEDANREAVKARLEAAHREEEKTLLEENLSLSKKVNTLQQEAVDNLTGGDSIFYLNFAEARDGTLEAKFEVDGEHPVRDLIVHITNIDDVLDLKSQSAPIKDVESKAMTSLFVGTVWPHGLLRYPNFPFPESGHGIFRILIKQPKCMYVQVAGMRRLDDGSHAFAYRMYRVVGQLNGKTELERLDAPAFTDPRMTGRHGELVILMLDDPSHWTTQYVVKDEPRK